MSKNGENLTDLETFRLFDLISENEESFVISEIINKFSGEVISFVKIERRR